MAQDMNSLSIEVTVSETLTKDVLETVAADVITHLVSYWTPVNKDGTGDGGYEGPFVNRIVVKNGSTVLASYKAKK